MLLTHNIHMIRKVRKKRCRNFNVPENCIDFLPNSFSFLIRSVLEEKKKVFYTKIYDCNGKRID